MRSVYIRETVVNMAYGLAAILTGCFMAYPVYMAIWFVVVAR